VNGPPGESPPTNHPATVQDGPVELELRGGSLLVVVGDRRFVLGELATLEPVLDQVAERADFDDEPQLTLEPESSR
jgi:hypothetical protein